MHRDEFIKKLIQRIDGIIQENRFETRTLSSHDAIMAVKYHEYPASSLNEVREKKIGSKAGLQLKSLAEIDKQYIDYYKKVFDLSNCAPFSNSQIEVNILRCIFDLSLRYSGQELLGKTRHSMVAAIKIFAPHYIGQTFMLKNIVKQIGEFFYIEDATREKVMTWLYTQMCKINSLDLTNEEKNVIQEFAYIAPKASELNKLQCGFYRSYYIKSQDKQADCYLVAAWILKTYCDIHPLKDGNGRVARTLAMDYLSKKLGFTFSDQFINELGKDSAYSSVTSGMNCIDNNHALSELKNWFVNMVGDNFECKPAILPGYKNLTSQAPTYNEDEKELQVMPTKLTPAALQ